MKPLLFIISLLTLTACDIPIVTSQGRYDEATKNLAAASSDEKRFYALNNAAKEAFNIENYTDAKKYAQELQNLTPVFKKNWNYGNAVQDFNLVLGRLAVKDGNILKAKEYLLAAGNSPGSPQMDTFGPNMSLAKDLIEKGEKEIVIEYLKLCSAFWDMDRGRLKKWITEVEAGKTPDFGANLVY